MDLIVTHINADFDGLSSLVAAKKLYPDSRLLLPGSQEKAVREFMSLSQDIIKVETEKECRLSDIGRLVIVDTRLSSRIGTAAGLLDKPGVEVHVYDHHPHTPQDIKPDKDVYKEIGATVTMLIDIIRKRGIKFSPLEATIMALGIYEETGSLTYRSTTKKDVDAVSFLLSRGANLNVVSSYLNRELSKEELAFLVSLIHSTELVDINGTDVAIASCDASAYKEELSILAHKLLDVENFKVLFFMASIKDSVRIIARSRVPSIDVNKILEYFGGGGHPGAASASVKGKNIMEVRTALLDVLKNEIKPKNRAIDIMTGKVKFFRPSAKAARVKRYMEAAGIECAIIRQKKELKGLITVSALQKAVVAGRGDAKIKSLMNVKLFAVGPNTPIAQIQRLIFEQKVGNILVKDKENIVGIITRTNVLKAVHAGLFTEFAQDTKAGTVSLTNISKKLKNSLPRAMIRLIKLVDRVSSQNSCHAFLVGGFVRDCLLGVNNFDLDIVVEGTAVKVAKGLVKSAGGTYVLHKRFGTATVMLPWAVQYKKTHIEELKIDFATARKERYTSPAALPTVEFSTVREDLFRRDFTINAMAIAIADKNFGQVIDFFGGQKDIANKKIRVLHDASFLDDPTRIFRAVRFEQRLDFRIEPHTEQLIKEAIERQMIDKTQKQRLRDELVLILKEDDPKKILRRMESLGELKFIHPRIRFTKKTERLFDSAKEAVSWFKLAHLKKRVLDVWLIYLILLLDDLKGNELDRVCGEFVFRKGEQLRLYSYKKESGRIHSFLDRHGRIRPSEMFKRLEPLSYEVILAIMAKSQSPDVKRNICDYLTRYNGARLNIKGSDLESLGLKAGPRFREILDAALLAKLDRGFKTKGQELSFVKRMIKHGHRGIEG